MRRGAAAALVAVLAGCATGTATTPTPGPGGGPVEVEVSAEPALGASLVLDLDAEGETLGSACATIDRWVDGGWRATWWYERSSSVPQRIPEGEEVTCPDPGVRLPTRMVVDVPAGLGSGTWRIAWAAGEDGLGAYVFEV